MTFDASYSTFLTVYFNILEDERLKEKQKKKTIYIQ